MSCWNIQISKIRDQFIVSGDDDKIRLIDFRKDNEILKTFSHYDYESIFNTADTISFYNDNEN